MEMTWQTGVISALSAIVAVSLVCWLARKDTKIENRRKAAIKLAATLKAAGFKRGTELATCYAVGDYSGLLAGMVQLSEDLLDPTQVGDVLKGPIKVQLPELLKNAEDRAWIFAAIDAYNAVNRPNEMIPPVGA